MRTCRSDPIFKVSNFHYNPCWHIFGVLKEHFILCKI